MAVSYNSATPIGMSFLYSITIHLVAVLLIIFGLPSMPKDKMTEQAMVVDIITVSEFTNIKILSQQKKAKNDNIQPKPQAKEPPQPIEKLKSIEPKPVPIKEVMPEPKVEPKPEIKKPAPVVLPPKVEPKAKAAEPKLNEKKVKKEKNAKAVMKTLKEGGEKDKKPEKDALDKKFQEIEAMIDGDSDKPFNYEADMTMSEIDSIRSQIKNAWNPIAFSGSGQIMRVTLVLHLDKAGNITVVKPVLEMNSNPSYGAFVESVVRAAHSASPLQNLSANKFQSWREMEINFTSEDMMY